MNRKRGGSESIDILLVEPDPDDARLFAETVDEAPVSTTIHAVTTGEAALDFLHRRGDYGDAPRPDIVVIDPHLPDTSDDDILATLKGTPEFRRIPVIVHTASDAEEDVIRSYDLHANAYIPKPMEPDEFIESVQTLGEFWLSEAKLPPKKE